MTVCQWSCSTPIVHLQAHQQQEVNKVQQEVNYVVSPDFIYSENHLFKKMKQNQMFVDIPYSIFLI